MAKANKTATVENASPLEEVKIPEVAADVKVPEESKKEEPVLEATIGAATVENAQPLKEAPKVEPVIVPASRPELDPTKPHEERFLAFLEGRKTGEFVKVNDFLKSLYPIPKPGFPPAFTDQTTMKQLKHLFLRLQSERKVIFSNNHFERLGKHYYDGNDVEQKTKYYNITNVHIEAKIPQ